MTTKLGKIIPRDHISITSAQYMLEISMEIFQRYQITGFVHTRLYNDSSRFTLTTCPEWWAHAIKQGYYALTRLDRHASCYQSGYFLWDAWNKDCPSYQIVVKDAEENFNGGRGISIVKAENYWVDKFEFSSETRNYWINQFYLSNIDLLENFVLAYKEKAASLIEQAHQNRNILIFDSDVDLTAEYDDTFLPANILTAMTPERRTTLPELKPTFTRRELECIKWLILGKTIPEIAIILNLSHRTLEKYIVSIKEKLGCYTLFQLGQKIAELGLFRLLVNI